MHHNNTIMYKCGLLYELYHCIAQFNSELIKYFYKTALTHLDVSEEALMLKNFAFDSCATALACRRHNIWPTLSAMRISIVTQGSNPN